MNISFDLVIPTMIVGFLITMVLSSNIMVTESSIENQVTYQLQAAANNALMVVEDQVKTISSFVSVSDSSLQFVNSFSDTVLMYQNNNYLMIDESQNGGGSSSDSYFLKLGSINFDTTIVSASAATILNVSVNTISSDNQQFDPEIGFQAFAERAIFLRNMKMSGGS